MWCGWALDGRLWGWMVIVWIYVCINLHFRKWKTAWRFPWTTPPYRFLRSWNLMTEEVHEHDVSNMIPGAGFQHPGFLKGDWHWIYNGMLSHNGLTWMGRPAMPMPKALSSSLWRGLWCLRWELSVSWRWPFFPGHSESQDMVYLYWCLYPYIDVCTHIYIIYNIYT